MTTAGSESRPARQEDPCRTREVLDIVGDKWSLLDPAREPDRASTASAGSLRAIRAAMERVPA